MPESAFDPTQSGITSTAVLAGGAGFIGIHLAQALLNQGIKVICIDNFSSGKKESLKTLFSNSDFSLIEQDINEPLNKIGDAPKIEWVFHLAGVGEQVSKTGSIDTLLVNSVGTHNLLELAKNKKAKFVLVSSADSETSLSSAKNLENYFGSDDRGNRFFSLAEATRFSESLTAEYVRKFDLDAVVVRVSDVYGPGMNLKSSATISQIINQALKGNKITLEGDGLEVLNPTYIQDVVFGTLKAAQIKESKGKILFLVDPKTTSALALAEELKKLNPRLDVVTKKGDQEIDLPHNRFDIKPSAEILGWLPKVKLSEGLTKTVESFNRNEPVVTKEEPLAAQIEVKETISEKTVPQERKVDLDTRLEKLFSSNPAPEPKPRRELSLPKITLPRMHRGHMKRLALVSSLALIILALVLPITNLVVNSNLAFSSLVKAVAAFEKQDYSQVIIQSQSSNSHLKVLQTELNNLNWFISLLNQRERIDNYTKFISFSTNLNDGLKEGAEGLSDLKSVLESISKNNLDSVTVNTKVSNASISLSLASRELTVSKLAWQGLDKEKLGPILSKNDLAVIEKGLANYQTIAYLNNNYGYLDTLLGISREKNTALIFKDKNQAGKVFLTVLKSKDAKVTPVYPTIDLTSIDFNLSPNLAGSVLSIQDALEKKIGINLSGTIIVDQVSFAKLGSILGLRVGEGKLDAEAKGLVEALLKSDYPKLLAVLSEFQTLTEQKHILASIDNNASKLLTQKVLGASTESDEGDYLYFTTTSLTPPKNDPKFSFRYRVSVDSNGEMKSGLSLNFTPAPDSRYLGEVRVYYPKGTTLNSVYSSKGDKITTRKLDLETKTMYSFNVEVVDITKTVELEVKLPYKLSIIKPTPYLLTIPKQPGVETLIGELVIELPQELRLVSSDNKQQTKPYRIQINTQKDYVFQGTFSNN